MADGYYFNSNGSVGLSERGDQDEKNGLYRSNQLLDLEETKVEIAILHDKDEVAADVEIGLSVYHQENPETKRAFHAHLRAYLTWDQAVALRDAIDCLIKMCRSDS